MDKRKSVDTKKKLTEESWLEKQKLGQRIDRTQTKQHWELDNRVAGNLSVMYMYTKERRH